ncbi:MAG: hypothetical protein GEV03_14190 [Streptosporangiales bacterium]|nr:hypothetical protein [Streptosporangiales bacterium]
MKDNDHEARWAELAQATGPVAGLLPRAGADGRLLTVAEVAEATGHSVDEAAEILAGLGCTVGEEGRVIAGDPQVLAGLPL